MRKTQKGNEKINKQTNKNYWPFDDNGDGNYSTYTRQIRNIYIIYI